MSFTVQLHTCGNDLTEPQFIRKPRNAKLIHTEFDDYNMDEIMEEVKYIKELAC